MSSFDDELDKKSDISDNEDLRPKAFSEKSKIKPKKPQTIAENNDKTKHKFKGSDIIFQRLKWDDSVDLKQVIIGYLDRFKGILEIKFIDFKGVHEDRDGIPLHRIRYFKINDKIVWDREKRIDLLTGFDITQYFVSTEKIFSKENESQQFFHQIPICNNTKNGNIEEYSNRGNHWKLIENNDKQVPFVASLKILTYNVLSTINLKKSIKRALEKGAHGLDLFENVNRTSKIIEIISNSNADLVALQECDLNEEEALRNSIEVSKKYFICSGNTEGNTSGCVILSKLKPKSSTLLKLSDNSSKIGLIVHFNAKIDSASNTCDFYFTTVHLASNMSKDPSAKRREQLEKLTQYLNSLQSRVKQQYFLIAGDFNLLEDGDDEVTINKLLRQNGFIELTKSQLTFDPATNLTAAITASNSTPRRLDRIYVKSFKNDYVYEKEVLLGKELLEINAKQSDVIHDTYNQACVTFVGLKSEKLYLHPSDHYALELTLTFPNSLHGSNTSVQSALALVSYDDENEYVQNIRKSCDRCYDRWPPHINLLHPFYKHNNIDNVTGDLLDCLSRIEPFNIKLNKLSYFSNNQVVFLEPSVASEIEKIKNLQSILKSLFDDDSTRSTWRADFSPHMTIAQPVDCKRDRNWSKNKCDELRRTNVSLNMNVSCVYWLIRDGDEPFKIKFVLPLGYRYPLVQQPTLNPDQSRIFPTKGEDETLTNGYNSIVNIIYQKCVLISECNSYFHKILPVGSFVYGVKANDIDLVILKEKSKIEEDLSQFARELTYLLCSNDRFKLVRYVSDAQVPIIEITLDSYDESNKDLISIGINTIDIQIHDINNSTLLNSNYTKIVDCQEDLKKLSFLSGIFENQNLKKFISNYKNFQILLSFVKHWAHSRGIYGKAFGYLGGISYAILVAYYLRSIDTFTHSILNLIFGFFKLFSNFQWSHQAISLVSHEQVDRETNCFRRVKCSLNILQSVYPYNNTSKNVSFRAAKIIADEFKNAYLMLNENDSDQALRMICQKYDVMEFSKNYIKFIIEYSSRDTIYHVFSIMKSKTQAFVANIENILPSNVSVRVFPELKINEDKNKAEFFILFNENLPLNVNVKEEMLNLSGNFIINVKNVTLNSDYLIKIESHFE